ncbi:RICIN domain-containing protein [Natrinema salinisoli]|uniref:RICIN domain-containing protein n=1 Tax=Natrinema salinisoli TaxID=2878535 RepID=UPI001CF011C7|nr:RICIN domain-containing protein [Natrinema salinisoli]
MANDTNTGDAAFVGSRRDLLRSGAGATTASLLGLTLGSSAAGATPTGEPDHRLLAWNAWLLEVSILGVTVESAPEPDERAFEIGEALAANGYDIAALCEVFGDGFRNGVRDGLDAGGATHRDRVGPTAEWNDVGPGSGLQTFLTGDRADRLIVSANEMEFDEKGAEWCDSDYYARKGVLHTEINVGPGNVDLYSTHLFAGGGLPFCDDTPTDRYEARGNQVEELIAFVESTTRPENVTMVMGDFNIARNRTEYDHLVGLMDDLGMYDAWEAHGGNPEPGAAGTNDDAFGEGCLVDPDDESPYYCDEADSSDAGNRIDYILVEEPKPDHTFELDVSGMKRASFWRGSGDPLEFYDEDGSPNYRSDHMGLELGFDTVARHDTYTLVNAHSGKVLDVDGVSPENGANVQQWDDLGQANQRWRLEELADGRYEIVAVHSHKALDVDDASTTAGANVHQWEGHGGDNQRWELAEREDGTHTVTNVNSGLVLAVEGSSTENGANVHQSEWTGGDTQRWSIVQA